MLITTTPTSDGKGALRRAETYVRQVNRQGRRTHSASRTTYRIILVDETRFTRDCLEHVLTCLSSEFAVTAIPKFFDIPANGADLVLVNLKSARLTESRTLSQVAEIACRYNDIPIVVLTDYDDGSLVAEAAGINNLRGHISGSCTAKVAIAVLRLIAVGGTFFPAQSAPSKAGVHEEAASQIDAHLASPSGVGLTHREGEILKLLGEGKPNKIIAYDLHISESTVKAHLRHILAKLRVSNRTAAALHAVK